MSSTRPERVGEAIRDELSQLIARDVRDPGVGFITLTIVKVAPDLQLARVYYTTMGDEKSRRETAKALGRATPFLRRQIAQRIRLRRAPELEFKYDDTIADLDNVEKLLEQVREERRQYELANPPSPEPVEGAVEAPESGADAEPVPQGDGDGGTADERTK